MTKHILFLIGMVAFIDATAQNVGIGTTAPIRPLHVRGSANEAQILLEDADSTSVVRVSAGVKRDAGTGNYLYLPYVGTTANRPFALVAGNGYRLTLTPDGKVGINTFFPTHGLDVNGDVNIAGPLTANNGVFTSAVFVEGEIKSGNITASGALAAGTNLTVNGTISSGSDVTVRGSLQVSGRLFAGLMQLNEEYSMSGNSIREYRCNCPPGLTPLGGGGGHRDNNASAQDIRVNFSGPRADQTGWRIILSNASANDRTVQVWAICARMQ